MALAALSLSLDIEGESTEQVVILPTPFVGTGSFGRLVLYLILHSNM